MTITAPRSAPSSPGAPTGRVGDAARAARLADAASRSRLRRRHRAVVGVALGAFFAGLLATLASAVAAESIGALRAAGGVDTAIGRVTGLVGSYLLLVMVLLMARLPALEHALGQDRLARWHRRIGGWPIVLIAAHATFITFGYAQAAQSGFLHQLGTFLAHYPDVLASTVAFGLLVMVGVTSWRVARRHLAYESWWVVHLYVYLALALAFAHQIVTGASFLAHPLARLVWSLAWAGTAGVVLVFRVGLPIARSLRHRLRVVAVREEAPGVTSLVLSGRHLDRLGVEGGQFFQWRFLQRGLWWQAHPYSLSALPAPPYLRLTVRTSGDHGRALARLRTGTRVAIEGPYGAFTASRRHTDGVLLVGAGVGITPLRAMLEALPAHVNASVVVRASSPADLVHHEELGDLVAAHGGTLFEVLGPRTEARLDAAALARLVPDVTRRDLYICGPDGFAQALERAALELGVPERRIHREAFAF